MLLLYFIQICLLCCNNPRTSLTSSIHVQHLTVYFKEVGSPFKLMQENVTELFQALWKGNKINMTCDNVWQSTMHSSLQKLLGFFHVLLDLSLEGRGRHWGQWPILRCLPQNTVAELSFPRTQHHDLARIQTYQLSTQGVGMPEPSGYNYAHNGNKGMWKDRIQL